jgi:hypothetical protein
MSVDGSWDGLTNDVAPTTGRRVADRGEEIWYRTSDA